MRKISLISLVLILVLSVTAVVLVNGDTPVANADGVTMNYKLYPNPQSITLGASTCQIPRKVNVQFSNGLDKYTVERGYLALSQLDLLGYQDATEFDYTIYAGIYGSNDVADTYAKTTSTTFVDGLFDKIDAYYLSVGEDATIVLGKDTDAVFYGLSTLKMIFDQAQSNTLRTVVINDWSDSIYRGFIEGYYGIPWTTDERVELMTFAGQFKSNIYIYAPKDDPYHSTNWRGLYSENDLEQIKEQVEAGNRSKVRFTWSIHPLLSQALTEANYTTDLKVLIAKFEQLYGAGVRSFMVSADDISTGATSDNPAPEYDATFQRKLLNDVAEWLRQKGDCHNLIFVPSAYNSASNDNLYLDKEYYFETLMGSGDDVLDPTIDVMWTGAKVCSSVSNGRFDDFAQLTGGRKAFMWMNWPVNDYLPDTILMSKGEVYDVKTDANGNVPFTGIVTNPMQYAEASKVGIFATVDYCWNVDAFDVDQSYLDTFQYLDDNCADELYNICSNIANANLFEGRYFEESWDLVSNVEAFWTAYNNGNAQDSTTSATTLKGQFEQIVTDVENYFANAENKKLLANLQPFAQSLSFKASAAANYLDAFINKDTYTKEQISQVVTTAETSWQQGDDCRSYVLNPVTYNWDHKPIKTCKVVINPFVQDFKALVLDEIFVKAGIPTGIVYRGFDGIYEGTAQNLLDGDVDTHVWFDGYPTLGTAFVRIDYETVREIQDITIYNGKVGGGDVWKAVVEYSLDGFTFEQIGEISGTENIFDLRTTPINARYIRIRDNSTAKANDSTVGNSWCALREIVLNSLPDNYVTSSGLTIVADGTSGVSCRPEYIIDGDATTFAWYDWKSKAGAYVQLNYKQSQTADYIRLLMQSDTSSDRFGQVKFAYSTDGVAFTEIDGTFSGTKEIHVKLQSKITFKYLRVISQEDLGTGVIIRDFSFVDTSNLPTITTNALDPIHEGHLLNLIDGSDDTHVWFGLTPTAESYVLLDYGKEISVSQVDIISGKVGDGDPWDVVLQYSVDGQTFYDLVVFNTETTTYIADAPINARYIRLMHSKAGGWVALRELTVKTA